MDNAHLDQAVNAFVLIMLKAPRSYHNLIDNYDMQRSHAPFLRDTACQDQVCEIFLFV